MRSLKTISYRVIVVVIVLLWPSLSACELPQGGNAPPAASSIPVSSVAVSGAGGAATISSPGGTLQLSAAVLPADASNKTVTWSVESGGSFASVSSAGLVTALDDGTARIKATAGDGSGVSGIFDIEITGQRGSISFNVSSVLTISLDDPVIYQASTDMSFSGDALKASASTSTGGLVSLSLRPGTYYVRMFHDLDNSGTLTPSDLLQVAARNHGGPKICFVPETYLVSAGDTTTIGGGNFQPLNNEWAYPVTAGTLKINASYTGSLGTVSSDNVMLIGTSTDDKLTDEGQMVAGSTLRLNHQTIYIIIGSGTYYLGGFYDADGDFDPLHPDADMPEIGDPVQVYNNKDFDGSSGDPIHILEGQETTVNFVLNDAYLFGSP